MDKTGQVGELSSGVFSNLLAGLFLRDCTMGKYKRNSHKMSIYKQVIGQCCHPKCRWEYGTTGLECHHIQPLYKGGVDEFINYIVLCPVCHRKAKNRLHSRYEKSWRNLLTYKFYIEYLKVGVMSKQEDELEFWNALVKELKIKDKEKENAEKCKCSDN